MTVFEVVLAVLLGAFVGLLAAVLVSVNQLIKANRSLSLAHRQLRHDIAQVAANILSRPR